MSVPGEAGTPVPPPPAGPAWRRLLGFALLPAIAAISPLVVLPLISRSVGDSGWASALSGEVIGTFAAIALAYGWTTIGPSLVASSDARHRGALYRQSLVVRGLMATVTLPLTVLICVLIASDGYELLAALMGLQGALIATSFTWFAVGVGRPGSIAFFDAIPRVVAAGFSAVAIGMGAPAIVFPLGGIAVTVVGTTLYSIRTLRRFPAPWPSRRALPGLFKSGAPVALSEAGTGAYSSVPTPLVTVTSASGDAAGYATADKFLKLGQFLPITLSNAFQNWTAEVQGHSRARRIRFAILAHALLGLLGWLLLATIGSFISRLLFADAAAPTELLTAIGLAFACYSTRTAMVRLVLFPAGHTGSVLTATLIASAIGLPLLLLGTVTIGPLGAAMGYALIELISFAWLVRRTISGYREITAEP